MKATELMVGDWVYCEGQPTPENVTIQTIAEDGVWFDGTNYEGAASYDRIFPIPLTSEILEKNGFVFVEGWWEIPRLPNGHGYVAIAFDPDGKGRPTNTIYDLDVSRKESGSADLHLNYVHELQHALRLCKINKEIVI